MKTYRVGTIGLGGIAQGVHLPGTDRSPDLQLAAVCDIDAGKLALIGERYKIPENRRFSNYRDLIACPDVDAVDICTPNDFHYEIALAAVEAGKPFSVEKPVTMNAKEAERLHLLAGEKGIPAMVCFSYRYKAAARFLRDLVLSGELGEIYHADMQYFQAWGLPDFETPLVWRFEKKRAASGALGDLGCHALDLVSFVTGKEYIDVMGHLGTYVEERELLGGGRGRVDVDDFSNYLCRMEGGLSASFQITRFAFGRGNYQRMEIYGSKGAAVYKLDETEGVDELEICQGSVARNAHVFTKLPIPKRYFADQMQSFADLLNGCGDGLTAGLPDGLKNQKVLDAVLESARTGMWTAP